MTSPPSQVPMPPTQRSADLIASLSEIKDRVQAATSSRAPSVEAASHHVTLVAVSKYKPASDIHAVYSFGHRDFGENYVQELVDKAEELPDDIKWHFIGTLQSNKAKILADIPNLHTIQTLTSIKTATLLQNALPSDREIPLNILIQVNTSGEDSKSGVAPIADNEDISQSDLAQLCLHIIQKCPKLRLQGLMTIGSISESRSTEENRDFTTLTQTRDAVQRHLESVSTSFGNEHGKLVLSMGMSGDFEPAIKAGADVVRVGTGIFGERQTKDERASNAK